MYALTIRSCKARTGGSCLVKVKFCTELTVVGQNIVFRIRQR